MRKVDEHVFKGLSRDTSISKQSAEYLWDAHNIRFTARDGETQLSMSNERGTEKISFIDDKEGKIAGTVIGYATISNYLVVFTTMNGSGHEEGKPDCIYRIQKTNTDYIKTLLYNGNLNFNVNYPLITLPIYENAVIQKIYWTDGYNQPRMINITKDILQQSDIEYTDNSFEFVPKMQLTDTIQIRRVADSTGMFPAGVIQYAISYYNKYGQESNISCISPLIPTSFNTRAGGPDERLGNSFQIKVNNPDTNFEYIRLYSIFRSSLDATPSCKRVMDVPVPKTVVEESSTIETTMSEGTTTISVSTVNASQTTKMVIYTPYTRREDLVAEFTVDDIEVLAPGETAFKKAPIYKEIVLKDDVWEEAVPGYHKGVLIQRPTTNYDQYIYRVRCTRDKVTGEKTEYKYFKWYKYPTAQVATYFFVTTDVYTYQDAQCTQALITGRNQSFLAQYYVKGLTNQTSDADEVNAGKELKYTTNDGVTYLDTFTSIDGNTGELAGVMEGIFITADSMVMKVTTEDTIITSDVLPGSSSLTFVDNGTIGDDIDPSELLYIGGEKVVATTMEQKDGTLFLSNIKQERPNIPAQTKTDLREAQGKVKTECSQRYAFIPTTMSNKYYDWANSLNAKEYLRYNDLVINGSLDNCYNIPTAGFKHKELYRLGVQFQYETGKWSEPVFVKDMLQGNSPSIVDVTTNKDASGIIQKLTIPTFKLTIPKEIGQTLKAKNYLRARAVIAQPSFSDRLIIAQGMLAPTVKSVGQAMQHTPDIQSSWFFRPWPSYADQWDEDYLDKEDLSAITQGSPIQWQHNKSLLGFNSRGSEIQGIWPKFSDTDFGVDLSSGVPDVFWKTERPATLGSSTDFSNPISYTEVNIGNGKAGDNNENIVKVYMDQCDNVFQVDQQYVTMHSPEFEFNSSFDSLDLENVSLKNIGLVEFYANQGAIDIQTSSGQAGENATGFQNKAFANYGEHTDRRLASGLFYKSWMIDEIYKDDEIKSYRAESDYETYEYAFMVYPWQRQGSLNNDCARQDETTRTAVLSHKVISNLMFSKNNYYYPTEQELNVLDKGMQYFNSQETTLTRVNGLNYYGNVDTLLNAPCPYGCLVSNNRIVGSFFTGNKTDGDDGLSPRETAWEKALKSKYKDYNVPFNAPKKYFWYSNKQGYKSISLDALDTMVGDGDDNLRIWKDPIRMKYKSTPHVIIGLESALEANKISDLQATLYLSELYREQNPDTDYSGTSDEALQSNLWIVAGDAVILNSNKDTVVYYDYGDTWYTRYDCLKTYAYADGDINSIVEIGSFMVESHTNLDGRYDRNRGLADNLAISPENFNLINTVYSQLDNFFNYSIQDQDYYNLSNYPATITWTTQKNNGSIIDNWTTITLASTQDVDGTKGAITSLNVYNDTLFCFQEKGISQILFNSRVQIPTSDGVPIEISNNYKVDGYRYVSDSIGSSNQFSIVNAPGGLYFIDCIGNELYLLGSEGLKCPSLSKGMSYWFSQQDVASLWRPAYNYDTKIQAYGKETKFHIPQQGLKCEYDYVNNDLYVISAENCLCYSDVMQEFTSFYSYENTPAMFSFGSDFYALRQTKPDVYTDNNTYLWKMFKGYYDIFFNEDEKVEQADFTFISNADSMWDKIFTNTEMRVDFYDYNEDTDKFDIVLHDQFFSTMQVTDEYQDTGEVDFAKKSPKHSNMEKKFRIWRTDIPRALKNGRESMNRIRNTWCKVKFTLKDSVRMELHDLGVVYYT